MGRTLGEEGGGCQMVFLFLTGLTGLSGYFIFPFSGRKEKDNQPSAKTIQLS